MNGDVWVTGIGVVTPHGLEVDGFWDAVKKGESCEKGVLAQQERSVVYVDEDKLKQAGRFINKKRTFPDRRRTFVIEAVKRAMIDAGIEGRSDAGVIVSCSKPTLGKTEKWLNASRCMMLNQESSDYDVPVAGSVEIPCLYLLKKIGFMGPAYNVTAGCVTGLMSIISAARHILIGDADIMVAGATEVVPESTYLSAYRNMGIITDDYKNFRPYHIDRNGFFISEGCGVVVLESAESAKKRNKTPYAVIKKWVLCSDPVGVVSMSLDGSVIFNMLSRLLSDGVLPEYINTHGTATEMNDLAESRAIKKMFKQDTKKILCGSTKPQTGHMLGVSSAIEFIISSLALRDQVVPPIINLDYPDPECDLNFPSDGSIGKNINRVVSLSYGFGCSMAGVLLERY